MTLSPDPREKTERCTARAVDRAQLEVNHLPLDILSRIFISVLPSDRDLHTFSLRVSYATGSKRGTNPQPLPLCAVCSLWRSVALSTPQLWRRRHIAFRFNMSIMDAEAKVAFLNLSISRSGALPLTLVIESDYTEAPEGGVQSWLAEKPVALIVQALDRYAARWETIYYFQQELSDFGLPEQLLDISECIPPDGWHALRQVYSSSNFYAPHQNKTVPWPQITHLEIGQHVSYREAIGIFRGCPKLVELSIPITFGTLPPSPVIVPPITLDNLKSLSLGTDCLSGFTCLITSPSLRELSLSLYVPTKADARSLSDLLTRSACNLDKLVLKGRPFNAKRLTYLPRASFISLTQLIIHRHGEHSSRSIDDKILWGLTFRKNGVTWAPLCPQLKCLVLDNCVSSSLSALVNMVSSRIGPEQMPDGHRRLEYFRLRTGLFDYYGILGDVVKKSGMIWEVFDDLSVAKSELWSEVLNMGCC
ncbi:hypothetical protein AX15_000849 [Amanita polypyramis BW_CC]|nr:hypothetical protein AX15_000849 [Amanita polypyramis BW_CC]